MNNNTKIVHPRLLWFLMLTYSMALVFANWFDGRLIHVFGLNTDAGTLIFPLTFILTDMITEVYGYKNARRAIWAGFLFNVLFVLYGQLVIHLPSPLYAKNNIYYAKVLGLNTRIIIASVFSYFCSEPLNALILAKLKIKMRGRWLAFRFVLSTVLSSGLDSFIFGIIAFYGMFSNLNLFWLILTMWFIKVFIEVIGLPFSVYFTKKLKAYEGLDIYDFRTRFNLFRWEADYREADNQFK